MSANLPNLASLFQTYLLYGRPYNRIKFGEESNVGRASSCDICRVEKGQLHGLGCSNEQCPGCGGICIDCDCLVWDGCERCEAKECQCLVKDYRHIKNTKELGILAAAEAVVEKRKNSGYDKRHQMDVGD